MWKDDSLWKSEGANLGIFGWKRLGGTPLCPAFSIKCNCFFTKVPSNASESEEVLSSGSGEFQTRNASVTKLRTTADVGNINALARKKNEIEE